MIRHVLFGKLAPATLLVSLAVAGCTSEHAHKPEVRLATLEELKSSVPKELLDLPPEDKAARARFDKLIVLATRPNQSDVTQIMLNWGDLDAIAAGYAKRRPVSKAGQLALVKRVWKANPDLVSNLEAVLISGPLGFRTGAAELELNTFLPLINLTRLLAYSAVSYGDSGDFKRATRLIEVLAQLGDAVMSNRGSLSSTLQGTLILGISTATNVLFARSRFPSQCCFEILSAMRPAPHQDPFLASAIKTDFLQKRLPELATDKPALVGAGSYDAIETAKAAAKASLIAISNARLPLSKGDFTYFKRLVQDANEVLKGIDPGSYEGPYDSFNISTVVGQTLDAVNPAKPQTAHSKELRSRLNRIPNSLGRLWLGQNSDEIILISSCTWRAERDLARILLASRVYRARHGGKLPATTAGFVPILGEWPTNPFDGKPFFYLPKQETVYGVGNDLADHGGDFATGSSGKDVGISLKLSP